MPLDALLLGLWRWRWATLGAALLLFAAGAAAVLAQPRRYVATALVAPAETTSIAASALLAPNSAGADRGQLRPTGNFAIYLDALRAPEAAALLARETTLLADITRHRAGGVLGHVRRALDLRIEADLDDAQRWVERNVVATQGIATVAFTLTVAHPDRVVALDMLRRLHAAAEAKVRGDLAAITRRRVAAIEVRLAGERDTYLRTALYELLAGQQRAALVVAAEEEVAARLVSAPMVPLRPSLPNRTLLLMLLMLVTPVAAVAGAVALLLLRGASRQPPAPPPHWAEQELSLVLAGRTAAGD